MSIAAGLTRMGRRQAESLMESSCIVMRVIPGVLDPATGLVSSTSEVIYSGVCRVRFATVHPIQVEAEGQHLAKQRGILSLPISSGGSASIRVDDVATITANPLDAGVIGLALRIAGPFGETHATARRFPVEVVS